MTADARPLRRFHGLVPGRTLLGTTLVAIAVIVGLGFVVEPLSRFTLLGVGLACLAAFALGREYGYAIAAGAASGVGMAIVTLAARGGSGPALPAPPGAPLLWLAGGFLLIWPLGLAARPRARHGWPLVPATILGVVGLALATGHPEALDWARVGVAVGLGVAGLTMLAGRNEPA